MNLNHIKAEMKLIKKQKNVAIESEVNANVGNIFGIFRETYMFRNVGKSINRVHRGFHRQLKQKNKKKEKRNKRKGKNNKRRKGSFFYISINVEL